MKTIRPLFLLGMLISAAVPLSSQTFTLPSPSADILYDFANTLGPDRTQQLQGILERVEKQTGVEVAIVTLPSIKQNKASAEKFTQFTGELFNQWGVGHKAVNNGVLLVVALNDRMMRFEFGSDFQETDLGNLEMRYNESILPLLQQENYSEAVFAASLLSVHAATESVSFWWFHRISILFFVLALVGVAISVAASRKGQKNAMKIAFVVTGVLLLLAVFTFNIDRSVAGFGGGAATGVGLTQTWA